MRRYAGFGAVLSAVAGAFLVLLALDRSYALSLLRKLGSSWAFLIGIVLFLLGLGFFAWQRFDKWRSGTRRSGS
jgi:protein-S-isoprenylcysteine O-methyltransferase Ste14